MRPAEGNIYMHYTYICPHIHTHIGKMGHLVEITVRVIIDDAQVKRNMSEKPVASQSAPKVLTIDRTRLLGSKFKVQQG
jgi:hypothetical protein